MELARQAGELTFTIVPLAAYFGFLGWVNIRRQPTVVNGRHDFIVVILAFLPLLYRPVRMAMALGQVYWQISVLGAVGVTLWLLLPREFTSWVVYSVSAKQLTQTLELALHRMRVPFARRGNRIECEAPHVSLVINDMPLLRNVTVHFQGERDRAFFDRVGQEVKKDLSQTESQPSLSGHCFLVVAAMLLLTPLLLIAHNHDVIAHLMRWLRLG
jgi:hypothetical protein